MATTIGTVSVKLAKRLVSEAAQLAEESGRDAQDILEELLHEGIRMRRVPGIVFADGATGRRARIAGTGIEVFEVVDVYRAAGRDRNALRRSFDWLNDEQLDAALAYYETYPGEIDTLLDMDEVAALHALWKKHPITRPAPH